DITAAGLIVHLPELGMLTRSGAASLAGLAPVNRESGNWKGRSFVQGGRHRVRRLLFMPALVAAQHNPDLKRKYEALLVKRRPRKVALTAVMRKLLVLTNALVQQDRTWTARPPPRVLLPGLPGAQPGGERSRMIGPGKNGRRSGSVAKGRCEAGCFAKNGRPLVRWILDRQKARSTSAWAATVTAPIRPASSAPSTGSHAMVHTSVDPPFRSRTPALSVNDAEQRLS
ncbi:MAG: IS110 family transposase, partial [Gemmatimonadetes bacterium]|nr:IS110 family transposase [Gemmatimonadota bacterium]